MLLHPETKVSIMVKISKTSELGLHNISVVWDKEVIVLLHVLNVVGNTQVSVAMAPYVVLSVAKRVIS